MQESFAFARHDILSWRARLGPVMLPEHRRSPVGQLVKSLISARTRDAVSIAAYHRLGRHFRDATALAHAAPREIEALIHDVTFAEAKAKHLAAALCMIAKSDGDFTLCHLAARSLNDALLWLERLPGVARKVAASTLNASLLRRPVMIVDTHVLRVLHRLALVRPSADYRVASEAVTAAMPHWSGDEFLGFHVGLKRLGQVICRWDTPLCEKCPLAMDCPTALDRTAAHQPVKHR